MKCALGGYVHICVWIFYFLTFSLIYGSPSRLSLFQGNPYSASVPRQRNKNWCAFVVHRNVSCAVVAATENVMEPHYEPCAPHHPDCAQRVIYHTRLRTIYKVGYKQVTELEWRCCPTYQGHDCTELKDARPRPHVLEEPRQSNNGQQQSVLGPELFSRTYPWAPQGHSGPAVDPLTQTGQHHQDSSRVQVLEEEVERLTQTVLDLQGAMTSATANLRIELQEDASKIIENMLGNLRQPQDVKTGGIESILLPYDLRESPGADELQNQVTHLSNTINTNTNSIQDLHIRIQSIDGQLHQLTETTASNQPSSTASPNECPCQSHIDKKLSALRTELLEGMDIKLSDLKNACDYKVMSVQEHCEEQETSYLSLAELLDSKETELRKEIQDLRLLLPNTTSSPGLNSAEVQKLKDNQQILSDAIRQQNATLAKIDVQGRVLEMSVKGAEKLCLNLEKKLRGERLKEEEEQNQAFEEKINNVQQNGSDHDQRLEVLERRSHILQDKLGALAHKMNAVPVLNQSPSLEGHNESVQQKAETLEVDCRRSQEQAATMTDLLKALDRRVASIEGVCGRFEPMSDSLKRIKDGLNKHVNGLWTCVRQLNSTVRTHTRDINTFKANSSLFGQEGISTMQYTGVREGTPAVNVSMEGDLSLSERPVMMSGEAGPPGTKLSLHAPQVPNVSITPVTGYAGSPGYPQFPAGGLSPDSVSAQIPLKTVQMASGEVRAMTRVSFSAGLTLLQFSGEIAIIRFNNVLLNDGGHYDPKTGVFTAPVDGRYLLSAVLTAQTGERVEASLLVANRNIQKLYTAGVGGGAGEGCVCGGSASVSLVLNLKRGQKAGLVLTSGKLAISAPSEILSSFSGVLLYPTVAKR
ncbi:EMILIN-2 Elastin microfibril interface-located protein 2 [Triplophysa tibetana]|uniref:EMILIN-2 Elastin microfibril interface-located protein 2 n=1 Tax=Triplophysa tibetana TaxID=1572043 RepID=A0A5A9PS73_9TELE|nr:EMILIN-2 Elastin microfibril interface-located protein 2 [Triplophysa tibetana]